MSYRKVLLFTGVRELRDSDNFSVKKCDFERYNSVIFVRGEGGGI